MLTGLAMLAQAPAEAASPWWQDASVALVSALLGALVGGAAAAFGSRWSVKRDLVERNRHALFMEDVPRIEKAMRVVRLGDFNTSDERNAAHEDLDQAIRHIKVRAAILGGSEREAGELIDDHPRSHEDMDFARAQILNLTQVSMRKIIGEPAAQLETNEHA